MHQSFLRAIIAFAVLSTVSVVNVAFATELFLPSDPPGSRGARGRGKVNTNRTISDFGELIGSINWSDRTTSGATWSESGSWQEIGPNGDDWFRPMGISAKGNTVVGEVRTGTVGNFHRDASYWNADDERVVSLNLPFSSRAQAINQDANVIAGTRFNSADKATDVFVWTESDGATLLNIGHQIRVANADMYVNGFSADGAVIAGTKSSRSHDIFNGGSLQEKGWLWSESTGLIELEPLNQGPVTGVRGMTPDGAMIVGYSGDYGDVFDEEFETIPFLWTTDNGTERLSEWPNEWWGQAAAITDDGSTIVGAYRDRATSERGGFIWRRGIGVVDLEDHLRETIDADFDLNVEEVIDMSGNGDWIRGTYLLDGSYESWVARVDALAVTGDVNSNGILDSTDVDMLTSAIRVSSTDLAFDLNRDQLVSELDLSTWVHDLKQTYFGDANLDHQFNTSDLVTVFQAGEYEDRMDGNSGWATGDWNGDGDFTSTDLVTAFQDGGYEQGPRTAANTVPEPSSIVSLFGGLVVAINVRRRGRMEITMRSTGRIY